MKDDSILKHIRLKKFTNPSITKKWIKWLNDKIVTKYSDQRHKVHSISSQKKYISNLLKSNSIFFKIYFKNQEIGNIILTNIDKNNENCEIGYLIGEKKFWNKGVASFVISQIVEFAFKKIKIKKIISWCYSNNIGSKKVLLKNKFKIEGRLKKFYKFTDNKRVDKIYFGLMVANSRDNF